MILIESGSAYEKLIEIKEKLKEIEIKPEDIFYFRSIYRENKKFIKDFKKAENMFDLLLLFFKYANYFINNGFSIYRHLKNFTLIFLCKTSEDSSNEYSDLKNRLNKVKEIIDKTFNEKELNFFYAIVHRDCVYIKDEFKFNKDEKKELVLSKNF